MIRNIWAVGRNYADHAKELGNSVPSSPLFFLKAGSCAVIGNEFSLPEWARDVHHELEIALQFGEDLEICSWGLALDLTERRLQSELKSRGEPWTLAKSFTGACPISSLLPWPKEGLPKDMELKLFVNGTIRQTGTLGQMIFSPAELVDFAKSHFPLCPGDLLLTGTPSGVGPLKKGDVLLAQAGSLLLHQWSVK
ncbi:MAG: fumarylacetoacetate hydrolase family protein [Bdellovibrionaceae bacterium]|nr:fumarylacetoacetate hydrolase family protein [Pseudobdellovibrionaceae bacterium]